MDDILIYKMRDANSKVYLKEVMENTLQKTWFFLSKRNDEMVERGKTVYNNVRKEMIKAKVPDEELAGYDQRFINLPWGVVDMKLQNWRKKN